MGERLDVEVASTATCLHLNVPINPSKRQPYSPQGTWRARLLCSAQTPVRPRPLPFPASPAEGAGAKVPPGPAPGGRGRVGGAETWPRLSGSCDSGGGGAGAVATQSGPGRRLRRAPRAPPAPGLALLEGARPRGPALPSPPTPLPAATPPSARTAGGGGGCGGGRERPLLHALLLSLARSGAEPAGPPTLPGPWPAT